MDVYCRRCGEPWETDTFHDVAEDLNISFDEAYKRFRSKGCVVITERECERSDSFRAQAAGELQDLLGDDIDGAASLLEDFDYAGMLS